MAKIVLVRTAEFIIALSFDICLPISVLIFYIVNTGNNLALLALNNNICGEMEVPKHYVDGDYKELELVSEIDNDVVDNVLASKCGDEIEVECKGECSRYGICFTDCITKTFHFDKLDLAKAMEDCHFIRQWNIEDVRNDGKRFLLYWWASTNIYMFCGKHNRCELPQCLIQYIRSLYKNPPGVAYSK